jgi:hypothetical protein
LLLLLLVEVAVKPLLQHLLLCCQAEKTPE